jgi:uncharacterized protein (TIGR02231 family)
MPPLLTTTITAVSVYPDRARVTRRGVLTLEVGTHPLEIADLPVKLNPDSVRATAYGDASARLLGVQVRRTFYAETPSEAIHQLEEQIESLQDNLTRLDIHAELIKHNRANLEALSSQTETYATALAAGEMNIEAQLALFDGLNARAEKLDAELQAITVDKRQLERRLQKLHNELTQQKEARPRERYCVTVEVEVLRAGKLTVELSYVISDAGWKPLYDVRLQEAGDKPLLEISYLAQVTQQTGENWNDVALTLSTARPALAGTLPELKPWYIQPLPLPPPPTAAPMVRAAVAPAGIQAAPQPGVKFSLEAKVEEAEEAHATVDTSGASVTYQVPEAVTVPADGDPHKSSVTRFSLSPKLDYVTAPKLVEAAYRRAKVINDSPYQLLPGAVNLFAGDEFIGTTQLKLTAPQEEISLYMGVDDRIKIKRQLKRRDVEKTVIGGKRRMHYGYEISLENLTPTEVIITLHDQIPASRHEDIKVKVESADPKPTEYTELNLLDWEITLSPKEKRLVRFDFGIEAPQGLSITGLP